MPFRRSSTHAAWGPTPQHRSRSASSQSALDRSVVALTEPRATYGADGAEFLAAVRKLLEEPLSLAL